MRTEKDTAPRFGFLLSLAIAFASPIQAQELTKDSPVAEECDDECQATRDAQDVTAAVNGVFFSNAIGFGPSDDNTLYNFQIQPIATVAQGEGGDLILRGIAPVLGVPVPAQVPVASSTESELDTEWGLSDTVVQALYVPPGQDGFRVGFGPQVSLTTHTEDATKAAGWGGGIAGGGFGFAGPLAFGGIANHLWGEDGYSTTTVQPIVYYNLETPGIGATTIVYTDLAVASVELCLVRAVIERAIQRHGRRNHGVLIPSVIQIKRHF